MSDDLSALDHFTGEARLFPLPNLVLFPHAGQPLHIFEPRYRQMTADALAGDRLIALVLLKPGWEADYQGRPALHSIACLGSIIADQQLDDGRYNILLRGLSRIRLLEEVQTGKLYRSARVELLSDEGSLSPATEQDLRGQARQLVPAWVPASEQVMEHFHKLLQSELPLGVLCDILSFALPLDIEFKQGLLEQLNVEERVRQLLHHLATHGPSEAAGVSSRRFPPDFSSN